MHLYVSKQHVSVSLWWYVFVFAWTDQWVRLFRYTSVFTLMIQNFYTQEYVQVCMYVVVDVWIHICMHSCVHKCTCVILYVFVHKFVYSCMWVGAFMCVWENSTVCFHLRVNSWLFILFSISMHAFNMLVCVYTFMYVIYVCIFHVWMYLSMYLRMASSLRWVLFYLFIGPSIRGSE